METICKQFCSQIVHTLEQTLKTKNEKKNSRNSPPVLRTTGIEPYRIATSCVRPHGSKIDGTRMKSEPAYIYQKKDKGL